MTVLVRTCRARRRRASGGGGGGGRSGAARSGPGRGTGRNTSRGEGRTRGDKTRGIQAKPMVLEVGCIQSPLHNEIRLRRMRYLLWRDDPVVVTPYRNGGAYEEERLPGIFSARWNTFKRSEKQCETGDGVESQFS